MYATKGYKLLMHYIIIQLHSQILCIVVIVAFTSRDEKLRLRTCKIYSKDVAMLKFAKFAQLCTALNLKIDNSFTLLHSYHCRRGNT